MELAPKPGSMEMRTPVYTFPGDRHISKEKYWAFISQGYVSSVPTVAGAAHGFGIDVDAETFERWKRTFAAASLLDDFLDTSFDIDKAYELYIQGIDYFRCQSEAPTPPLGIDERLEPGLILLGNSTSVLPQENQATLYDAAHAIAHIALWKSGRSKPDNITDYSQPKNFTELLKSEATYTSKLVKETTTEYVRNQSGFELFSTWCDNALVLGTVVNHTLDLRQDFRNEVTQVKPTLVNRARIAKHIAKSVLAMTSNSKNLNATMQSLYSNWEYRLHSTHASKK